MFYLTRRRKRQIIITIIALLIIAAVATSAVMLLNNPKEETTKEQTLTTYTQYNPETDTCIYYYDEGNCFVPLSFCVNEEDTQTPQEIDREKYCSETPELTPEALESEEGAECPFIASEGDTINLQSIVQDPDELDPNNPIGPLGKLIVEFSAPFDDTNGIWKTEEGDEGIHHFTIRVSDGEFTRQKSYCIEVTTGNRPPVLSNVRDVGVLAGKRLILNPTCVDPDGDQVTLTYKGGLTDREWIVSAIKETEAKDIGKHIVTIACVDSRGLPVYKTITVTVFDAPTKPKGTLHFVEEPEDITVNEGNTIVLNPQVASGAGKQVDITYSGWMTTNTKETDFKDAGIYKVTITATDGDTTLERTITIKVLNVNRPPEIVETSQI
jgi:hypothetical protein